MREFNDFVDKNSQVGAELYFGLGRILNAKAPSVFEPSDKTKIYEDAAAALNESIKLNPKNKDSYLELARAKKGLKEDDAAVDALMKALEAEPQDKDMYPVVGQELELMGKKTEALAVYEQYLALNPNADEKDFDVRRIKRKIRGMTENS